MHRARIVIEEVRFGGELYGRVTELRRELLRRPLGLDFTADELAQEVHDLHLAALENRRVVGTLLLRRVDARVARIMRMAVAADVQGRSIGRALVQRAEAIASASGYETITMHARATAAGFYEKCGYGRSGGEFPEQGIAHVRMEKPLNGAMDSERDRCRRECAAD